MKEVKYLSSKKSSKKSFASDYIKQKLKENVVTANDVLESQSQKLIYDNINQLNKLLEKNDDFFKTNNGSNILLCQRNELLDCISDGCQFLIDNNKEFVKKLK